MIALGDRTYCEYKRIFNREPFSSLNDDEKAQVSALFMDIESLNQRILDDIEVTTHFGEIGYNSSTLASLLYKIEEDFWKAEIIN